METIQAIYTRKSVRSFLDKEIEQEKIDILMHAAMAAPSAINRQPWFFHVIQDNEIKGEIIKAMPFGKYKSPIIIIPAIKESSTIPFNHDLAVCDLSAATENILLAAHDLGLGAVWCAIFPNKALAKSIAKILKSPAGITPFCAIYVGYPSEDDKSQIKNKYNEKAIKVI